MSFHDPEDKSTYQEEVFTTIPMSHGRITLEGSDKVINLLGCYLVIEKNTASQNDKVERYSIVIRGGKWFLEDKIRDPKNAATFRFPVNDKVEAMLDDLNGFITEKTARLFFCTGRKK
jgi:hypothetical protein